MGTERGRAAKVIGFAPFSLRDREGREGGREGIMFRLFLALFVQRSESQFIRSDETTIGGWDDRGKKERELEVVGSGVAVAAATDAHIHRLQLYLL